MYLVDRKILIDFGIELEKEDDIYVGEEEGIGLAVKDSHKQTNVNVAEDSENFQQNQRTYGK